MFYVRRCGVCDMHPMDEASVRASARMRGEYTKKRYGDRQGESEHNQLQRCNFVIAVI